MDPTLRPILPALVRLEGESHDPAPDEYLRDIATVMALPENQSGADKSWLWPAYEYYRRHFAGVRPA